MANSPFKTYEVTTVKTVTVATITEENIGQIAALVKGQVDYSGKEPKLVEPGRSNARAWRIGMTVGPLGESLINQTGVLNGHGVVNVKEVPSE